MRVRMGSHTKVYFSSVVPGRSRGVYIKCATAQRIAAHDGRTRLNISHIILYVYIYIYIYIYINNIIYIYILKV